jgi:hypothetical protein
LEQLPLTPEWLKRTLLQLEVERWHSSHWVLVWICCGDLPVAVTPL